MSNFVKLLQHGEFFIACSLIDAAFSDKQIKSLTEFEPNYPLDAVNLR